MYTENIFWQVKLHANTKKPFKLHLHRFDHCYTRIFAIQSREKNCKFSKFFTTIQNEHILEHHVLFSELTNLN